MNKLSQILGLTPHVLAEVAAELKGLQPDTVAKLAELPPLEILGKCNGCPPPMSQPSFLQELMLRVHRILFILDKLPLSQFGEFRHRKFGKMFDKTALSRRAFVLFNRQQSHRVAKGSRCLGWDDTRHVSMIRGCTSSKLWTFTFRPIAEGSAIVDHTKHQIQGDLSELRFTSAFPLFDAIVCNQVFEHVPEPFAAARAIYSLLRPGGILIWTAPFLERHHFTVDFFRFTAAGAREIFVRAGFSVPLLQKVGDSYSTSAYVLGAGAGDIPANYTNSQSPAILRDVSIEHTHTWEDKLEWLYMGVALVAEKPAGGSPVSPAGLDKPSTTGADHTQQRSHSAADGMPGKMACQTVPWVDVVLFGHEVDMLRYRLKVHAPIFSAVVIVESNLTHTGLPKPLYARDSLTAEEIALYGITLVNVPLHEIKRKRQLDGSARINMAREQSQRKFINEWLSVNYPRHRVHMSDVDELVDPQSVCALPDTSCVTLSLRFYLYGIHCAVHSNTPWMMSMLVRTDSDAFKTNLRKRLPMRGATVGYWPAAEQRLCRAAPGLQGWHLSDFFNTSMLVRKFETYNHNDDTLIQGLLQLPPMKRDMVLEDRVERCIDARNQKQRLNPLLQKLNASYMIEPYDGRMPPVPGWPRHPKAPSPRGPGAE